MRARGVSVSVVGAAHGVMVILLTTLPCLATIMSSVDSYRIKRVRFFGRKVPILCQNENGPCPLLAIGNILLLQSNISIHPDLPEISFNELTQLVAGYLLDSNPPHEDVRINANQQTQLDTVIKLLPRLQYGLDVNVRFNSVRGFEFTEEMAAFDMSGITLLHGWLLDPEDKRTGQVIEGMSYNKLVEKLLDFRSAMTAASDQGEQDQETAEIAPSGASGVANSRENDQQEESMNDASTTEEESVGPARACGDDGAVVVGDTCGPLGENGASPASISANQEGSGSTLHREGTASDACARATTAAIADEESAKVATVLKEGQVAEDFFRETASQLTYYGLSRLHQEVRERQLCVFFRNNHFSTMFKYDGKLYLLITDLGYARESSVVWEKLDQIDGNTEYADSDFSRSSRCSVASGEHHDADFMLALALHQEDASALASASPTQPELMGDEAVAMALLSEDRAQLELRRGGGNDDTTLVAGRQGVPLREDRERRRPPESGSSCSIQ